MIARRDQAIADGSLPPNAKVIVRANSADGVRDLFDAFKAKLGNRHDGILGVHNRFKLEGDTGAQLRPDVPNDLAARPERFLIHQFMLTEGIDDPSCTMLALFEPFSTERQLVQQFGRLTRHPTPGTVQAPALVVTTMPDEVARMWGGFLSFDRICMENGGKPPLHAGKEVLEKLVEALPAVDYVDGRFRTRVELDGDFTDELRVPRSALVFELGDGFDMDAFRGEIEERLYEMDRIEAGNGGIDDGACRFHLSLALTQSRFLAETLFLSPSLEATIYSKSGSHLYFYDSGGLFLDEVKGLKRRASAAQMRSLLAEGADNRITQLHLKNTDLGPAALRSRSQTARSLARAGVFMGEHLNVVTRATGLVDGTRRAVAFTSSRVREGEGAQASPADFHTWAAQVDTELHAAKPAADLFGRFALPIAAPPITVPANILIDIDDVSEGVRDAAGAPVEFDTNDVCQDIVPDPTGPEDFKFRFSLKINGKSNPVWIKWDKLKQKYWLRSEELSKFKIVGSPRTSLTNRLNQRQPFRILPQNLDAIYAFGQFYSIDLKLAAAGGTGALVLDLLTDVAGLTARTTEKEICAHQRPIGQPTASSITSIERSHQVRPRLHWGRPFPSSFAMTSARKRPTSSVSTKAVAAISPGSSLSPPKGRSRPRAILVCQLPTFMMSAVRWLRISPTSRQTPKLCQGPWKNGTRTGSSTAAKSPECVKGPPHKLFALRLRPLAPIRPQRGKCG